ncbi:MAG: response regulator [Deltaproteobacteria bacterium]|nr:response regulator [Deltaproteobacteria bacterium]
MRLLERKGHRVTVVDTGIRALETLEKASFDLILMDIQMPEMDGFETTREIRRREKKGGGHLPIIALTANAMKGDREKSLAAGMDDHIVKPIQPDRLFEKIGRYAGLVSGNRSRL